MADICRLTGSWPDKKRQTLVCREGLILATLSLLCNYCSFAMLADQENVNGFRTAQYFFQSPASLCDEMARCSGAALCHRISRAVDFSCALFDGAGRLCAQAAHIPVYLGSMTFAMADPVSRQQWQPDSRLVLNDPYLGGTHLPDITLVAPVFLSEMTTPLAFAVTHTHHANVGSLAPGSMPVSGTLADRRHDHFTQVAAIPRAMADHSGPDITTRTL